MPKLQDNQVPSYRLHKQSGQAIVTLNGKDILLGKHGAKASRDEYSRVIAEWLAAGRQLPPDPQAVTVAEVAAAFRKHARSYYRDADGAVSKTVVNFDEALRQLLKLYGRTPAAEFGPLRLKAVRQAMIDEGRVRTSINRHVTRIKHVFKWAVENEMIPPSVHHGLLAVSGLRLGRYQVKESQPVQPVPVEHVHAVLPHVSRQVKAMIELQLLTGMRPGEVVIMRGCDIDTAGRLWVYRPQRHKTALHGHVREIYLGPQAQGVIRPFLKPDLQAYLFSPADAERERRERLHERRKSPLCCGNRPGTNRRRDPHRVPGERYTVSAYYLAVQRGCELGFGMPPELRKAPVTIAPDGRPIPETAEQKQKRLDKAKAWRAEHCWFPHQLRHTVGTRLRKEFGVEAAQVILGHKRLNVTELYAEKNVQAAQQIMNQVG